MECAENPIKSRQNSSIMMKENSESSDNSVSMVEELEKQLHEQYAINNNANLSSIIALMVGLFTAIGAYGHVFIHTEANSCVQTYTISQFMFTAFGCFVVLAIMLYICIYQGFAQRYEQFITYAIRYRYYTEKSKKAKNTKKESKNKLLFEIFPDTYHPFNKKGLKRIQGLYGEFVVIISALIFLLIFTTIYRYCVSSKSIQSFDLEYLFIVIASVIIAYLIQMYDNRIKKYEELQKEYAMYKPKE